jgi:hypothetical protein
MAYSKTPMQDTDQTKQIPLFHDWESRENSLAFPAGTRGTEAQNLVVEVIKNEVNGDAYVRAIKRDGSELVFTMNTDPGEVVCGIYYWKRANRLVGVSATRINFWNLDTGVLTTSSVINMPNGPITGIGFTEFLYDNGTTDLVVSDGQFLNLVNQAAVVTVVVDPDFPPTHNPYPVFLDGYLFVSTNNGHIYNSDLNTPTSWQASNLLDAEAYPDELVALARVGVYIVAFGTQSTEYFYNAANPTGTPLARVDGATKSVGYLMGLASHENALYIVGKNPSGIPTFYELNALKLREFGTETSRRWLNNITTLTQTRGSILTLNGHRCYCITTNRNNLPVETFYYDLDTNFFSSLQIGADGTGGPFIHTATEGIRTVSGYAQVQTYFGIYNSNEIQRFNGELYQDKGVNFTVRITTRPQNFGTQRVKFGGRMILGCDQTPTPSLMNLSWSDDDYLTFSTPRTIDASNAYTPLYALGSFRKRVFRLTYTDNFPMRWTTIELDYQQGQA